MEGPWKRDEENLKYLIESTSVVDGRFEHQTAASGSVEYHGDADDSEQGWSSFFGKTYHAKTNNHGNTRGKVNPDAATAIKEKWPKMIGHPEQKILYAMEQEILNQKKGFRSVTLHLYSTQGICPACKRALSITRKALRDASILFDVKMYYGHYNPESSYGWKGDPKLSGSFFHYYLN